MPDGENASILQDATCGPDEKLQPDEVPILEVSGLEKMPQTEHKVLLVFGDDDTGTLGVRLEHDDARQLHEYLSMEVRDDV